MGAVGGDAGSGWFQLLPDPGLETVSNPELIWDLYEKLKSSGIFLWTDVVKFSEVFHMKGESNAAIRNVSQPAVERWAVRNKKAQQERAKHQDLFEHAKTVGGPTFTATAENDLKEAQSKAAG